MARQPSKNEPSSPRTRGSSAVTSSQARTPDSRLRGNDEQGKAGVTPRLRFPEFRKSWDSIAVSDFFDLAAKAEKTSFFDGDRLLTVKLHCNGVVKNEKSTLTGGANYFTRKAGQFIFSKIDLLNGAFGIVPDSLDGFSSSSDVPAYSFKAGHSPIFFLNWLKSHYSSLQIERTGTSSTLKRVSPEKFLALAVVAPLLDEQQKIADCLTSLDEVIAAQGRKVEALKTHKRGLMQQLFPREGETRPRLRFPEFRDAPEWEPTDLGRLAEFRLGGTPSKADPQFWNGDIPWVSAKDMKTLRLGDAADHITSVAVDNGAKLVPAGTLLMLTRGMTLLKDVPICIAGREMSFNQDVKALFPKAKVRSDFLAFLLLANKFRLLNMVDVAGHGTGKLDTDELKSFDLTIPNPKEQKRIADCLSSLDTQITAEANQLAALKTHKQGLMQQLFPLAKTA